MKAYVVKNKKFDDAFQMVANENYSVKWETKIIHKMHKLTGEYLMETKRVYVICHPESFRISYPIAEGTAKKICKVQNIKLEDVPKYTFDSCILPVA